LGENAGKNERSNADRGSQGHHPPVSDENKVLSPLSQANREHMDPLRKKTMLLKELLGIFTVSHIHTHTHTHTLKPSSKIQ
jgi:hypothetical protein